MSRYRSSSYAPVLQVRHVLFRDLYSLYTEALSYCKYNFYLETYIQILYVIIYSPSCRFKPVWCFIPQKEKFSRMCMLLFIMIYIFISYIMSMVTSSCQGQKWHKSTIKTFFWNFVWKKYKHLFILIYNNSLIYSNMSCHGTLGLKSMMLNIMSFITNHNMPKLNICILKLQKWELRALAEDNF